MYLLLSLLFSFIIGANGVDYERPQTPPHMRIPDETSRQINASFPVTFYRDAYVDFRTTPPRLRIFALAGCVKDDDYLSVDVFYKGFRRPMMRNLKVFGDAHKANCASQSQPGTPCFYVANGFVTNLTVAGNVEKILIHMENRKVALSVKEVHGAYEKGLTVCLQPIYYYSQWQNVILYIEAWRAQGATRFIMYYNSATRETRKVLEYYRDEMGLIELRAWPSFGALPPQIRHLYPKFDDATYSFSFFLAMNLCILDIRTEVGTVADLDEVLVPRNGTVLEYAEEEMRETEVGALSFENHYVKFEPSIYDNNDFSGVAHPTFLERRHGGCKATSGQCKTDMDSVYDWIYERTEGVFLAGEFE